MTDENINILIIDDNAESIEHIRQLVSACHEFKISHKLNIESALKFLKSQPSDIVLLQLTIGLDAIKQLRLIKSDIPIIVMGWINDEASIEEILKSGANDYLLENDLKENKIRRAIRFALARYKGQIEPLGWTTSLVNKLHLMEALYKVITQNTVDLDEQIQHILKTGCELFDQEIAIFSHIVKNDFIVEQGYSTTKKIKKGQKFDLKKTFCSITIEHTDPIAIDIVRKPKWKKHPCYLNTGLLSYIGINIYKEGDLYGTLSFSSSLPKDQPFRESDFDFIKTLAEWMRNILSQTHTSIDSELLDMHDPVTGLMNKETFIEDLDSCVNRTLKSEYYYFALLFFDIVNLHEIKTILDKNQSNNFMKLIGKRLKTQLRPRDTIARFSETTFVILLEDVYINETSFAAERIIAEIQKPISIGKNILSIIPSIGIALSSSYKSTTDIINDAESAIKDAREHHQTFYVINPEHGIEFQESISQSQGTSDQLPAATKTS
ncbi:MAG: diguanylate cyclase [Gammaproteobacteria bacterium]|nr:diguanylate cyclase [Gammaproteobacteria bacterium]